MKEILLQLILEDMKMTRLVRSLGRLDIDATHYLPNISKILFNLTGMEMTDDTVDEYLKRIEKGADMTSEAERKMLAQDIHAFLENPLG